MSRINLSQRIVIESGIYQRLKLTEIAKKIGISRYTHGSKSSTSWAKQAWKIGAVSEQHNRNRVPRKKS